MRIKLCHSRFTIQEECHQIELHGQPQVAMEHCNMVGVLEYD